MTYALLTMMNLKIITTIFLYNFLSYPEDMKILVRILVLSIEFHDTKFTTELFDKKDAFPFYINSMPYLDSNILSKIFYASTSPEILCITRATTVLINMVTYVDLLLTLMKKQK